jgi:P-type Ca2+ transporter type 2C
MTLETVQEQKLTSRGLTPFEVEASRKLHGSNVLTPPKRDPWWKLYLEKFEDPVIRILIIAAVVTMIVGAVDGHFAEGIGIIIAIFLATTLGFVNEYRAKQEFDILNQVNDEVAINVIRNGAYTTAPRKDLVVGDIVLIEVGDEAPADGKVIEQVSLQVNESLLTGESLPVHKTVQADGEASVSEGSIPASTVYRGTTVVDGRGTIALSAVGDKTAIGEIAREASGDTDEVTPLNAQLERLSKLIGVVGFAVAALTYVALVAHGVAVGEIVMNSSQWLFTALLTVGVLVGLCRVWIPTFYDALELAGRDTEPPSWLENNSLVGWLIPVGIGVAIIVVGLGLSVTLGWLPSASDQWLPAHVGEILLRYFLIAVTIIVVAVPEGLPMSVTLSLAYSMRKMTATNNLVRRMHAVETIGASTVICSDKTGTLTLNQMRVHDIEVPALDGKPVTRELKADAEKLLVEGISVNTTANLSRVPGEPIQPIGDTTEGALLLWLEGKGIDYIRQRTDFGIQFQLTFSSDRKYMATIGKSAHTGADVLYVKGAPEVVLSRCSHILTHSGLEPIEGYVTGIESGLLSYQRRGMRTLGFAYQPLINPETVNLEDLASDLVWLGFVAIADPIRPEVPAAIQACRDAGIKVKIVTGDNPETAREIARQIGLWEPDDDNIPGAILMAKDFAELDEPEAKLAAQKLKVLSRARPLDKMRLVKLLQDEGDVVAVTGDGTNDAPALNYANVGLAMGSGTDIAKEASDIVLLDDSFKSIVNAVMWGRSLYENIQRFILFQLTINVAALGIALLGPFIGVEFPLTVIQMLWVNLIMDTFASLALATEPPHWDVMDRSPRRASEFIISPTMGKTILGMGAAFIVLLVAFLVAIQRDGAVVAYELSVFYTLFVMLQFWNLFNARSLGSVRSALSGLLENRAFLAIAAAILIGQILIIQFGGDIFRTVPLTLTDWLLIIGGTSIVLWLGEIWRYIQRARMKDTLEAEAA